jgi:hypothetical protein
LSCFPSTLVCKEDKPLLISTLFIIALLAVIEPLAKALPSISNASVAGVSAPILNPLSRMLCLVVSFLFNSVIVFALRPNIPEALLYEIIFISTQFVSLAW